jgi:hypothetical protein
VAQALVALVDEEDVLTRLNAAYGLLLRDDPRTDEAIERVGPLGAGFEHDHRASAFRRRQWEKDQQKEKASAPPRSDCDAAAGHRAREIAVSAEPSGP